VTVCREHHNGPLGFGNVVKFQTYLAAVSSYSDLITGILNVLCPYVRPSLLVFENNYRIFVETDRTDIPLVMYLESTAILPPEILRRSTTGVIQYFYPS
jgi:hypothetical protein